MADLMIDLEGLGTGPDTTILTIAAQSFDPLGNGYNERFYYARIDLESQELREELGYRRRLLAKVESDGSIEKEKLDKLKFEVDSLDKQLSLTWPEYAQQKKNLLITWDQVQQSLEEGEAAIEFERFKNKSD